MLYKINIFHENDHCYITSVTLHRCGPCARIDWLSNKTFCFLIDDFLANKVVIVHTVYNCFNPDLVAHTFQLFFTFAWNERGGTKTGAVRFKCLTLANISKGAHPFFIWDLTPFLLPLISAILSYITFSFATTCNVYHCLQSWILWIYRWKSYLWVCSTNKVNRRNVFLFMSYIEFLQIVHWMWDKFLSSLQQDLHFNLH